MSDIALRWDIAGGDLVIDGADALAEDGLETAVLLSLRLDQRADEDDGIPLDADPRGWWGDTFADVAGDQVGSKLWLLGRSKQLASVAQAAQSYAQAALKWLLDDGVASSVVVTADWGGGVLLLSVAIQRPDKAPFNRQYQFVWSAT